MFKSITVVAGLAASLLALTSCATVPPAGRPAPLGPLARGMQLMEQKKYYDALEQFEAASGAAGTKQAMEAMLRTAECYRLLGDCETAIQVNQRLIREYPAGRLAAQAQYQTARCYFQVGGDPGFTKTRSALELLYETYRDSAALAMGQQLQGEIAASASASAAKKQTVKLDAEDLFGQGKQHYENKKYDKAAEDFKEVVFNYSGTRIASEASFLLGECYFNLKEYDIAIEQYLQFVTDYPTAARADEAQIRLAESYLRLSPNYALDQSETGDKALAEVDRFFEKYPDSKLTDHAKAMRVEIQEKLARKDFEAGKFYVKRKQFRSAKIYLEGIVREYPDTKWAAEAKTMLTGLPEIKPLPGVADSVKIEPAVKDSTGKN
ncbi:MAG: outer membrane protein assembly factor BamD [Candidatus Edwardsbacteria bacterium]|nr:outer membrane protein assembly factor BamD [Candidatus Edwardsbacteria bacterium]